MSDGNGMFGRDQARLDAGYDLEHTAYFDGTMFADVVQKNESEPISKKINEILHSNSMVWMNR